MRTLVFSGRGPGLCSLVAVLAVAGMVAGSPSARASDQIVIMNDGGFHARYKVTWKPGTDSVEETGWIEVPGVSGESTRKNDDSRKRVKVQYWNSGWYDLCVREAAKGENLNVQLDGTVFNPGCVEVVP